MTAPLGVSYRSSISANNAISVALYFCLNPGAAYVLFLAAQHLLLGVSGSVVSVAAENNRFFVIKTESQPLFAWQARASNW